MHAPLPVVVSVPHGGLKVPDELVSDFNLDLAAVLYDSDTWARELFLLQDRVAGYLDTEIARIVLDLNRSASDLPPENPDGVIKTIDVRGNQVWSTKGGLSPKTAASLIERYHCSYHNKLTSLAVGGKAVLGIDCHTMLQRSPHHDETGTPRPMICISNRGDEYGEPSDEPITAPAHLLRALQDALYEQFQHEDINDIALNRPFQGGYITMHHGTEGALPWIQVEINRALYLPAGKALTAKPDELAEKRLTDLREKFCRALRCIL